MNTYEKLQAAASDTMSEHVYTDDIKNNGVREFWDSFEGSILDGIPDKGDCEDVCLTFTNVAVEKYGLELHKFKVHKVVTPPFVKQLYNHLCVSYGFGTDEEVFFDNIFGRCVTWNHVPYKFYSYSRPPIYKGWYLHKHEV